MQNSIPRRFRFPGVTHRLRDGIFHRKRSLKNVLAQLGRRCVFFGWRQTFLFLFFQFSGTTVRQFSHLEMTGALCFYYCWLSLGDYFQASLLPDKKIINSTCTAFPHEQRESALQTSLIDNIVLFSIWEMQMFVKSFNCIWRFLESPWVWFNLKTNAGF